MGASGAMERLITLMAALRTPGSGCPWDLAQTFATIVPYTIEEAYEVAEAIERGDFDDLKDELGDLLLQVVYHARMAEERDLFGFADVAEAICQKLVRRHPHVFGKAEAGDPAAVDAIWADTKARESEAKRAQTPRGGGGAADPHAGALGGIPLALPALARADKIGRRAARTGFDWGAPEEVVAKIREELSETEAAIAAGDREALREEVGDLLFAVANLARYVDVDPEGALRAANNKFVRRFQAMEAEAARRGQSLEEIGMPGLDELWNLVKARERDDQD